MEGTNPNKWLNEYVRDNLSPKPAQRDYIDEKYDELKGFMGGNTFRSGSYARYTAVDPVHDLDVINPLSDTAVESNPQPVIQGLIAHLRKSYSSSSTVVKRIYAQTHSVTVELGDSPEGSFSIDVAPAIKLNEPNGAGDSLYKVPEIMRMNRTNREKRYAANSDGSRPIGWVKTDPKGYVKVSQEMNKRNGDFRHAVKLVKSWRHQVKMIHGDEFRLKSFHLEQIMFSFFEANPSASTVDGVLHVFVRLPSYIQEAQIQDRADPAVFIDEYVNNLTPTENRLILQYQARAARLAARIPNAGTKEELAALVEELLDVDSTSTPPTAPVAVKPSQPWAY